MASKIKYYRNNPLLKGVGVQLDYTADQIEEYLKCKDDPIYFIKNYVKIVHVDKGLVNFELYDYQEEFVNLLNDNTKVVAAMGRQLGKCFLYVTDITIKNPSYNKGLPLKIKVGDFYLWMKHCNTMTDWKSFCDKYLCIQNNPTIQNDNITTSN
jgi:hypothetical protein